MTYIFVMDSDNTLAVNTIEMKEWGAMYKGKKIGVVILNYNDAKTTANLCNHIYTYEVIDKIVIVDNHSIDDSYERLLKLKALGIDVIKCYRNGGYSSGNNYGANYLIEQYNIEILFVANPDVEFTETFVEGISNVLISGNAKAASGIMLNDDGHSDIYSTKANSYLRDLLSGTLIIKKIVFPKRRGIHNNGVCMDTEILPGSLFAIDSKAFMEIGGFDEGVFLYCEEAILGKRLMAKGYTLKLVTTEQFKHHHSVSINKSVNRLNRVKQIYKSTLYYWYAYGNISRWKLNLMKRFFQYGIFMRKIMFEILKTG